MTTALAVVPDVIPDLLGTSPADLLPDIDRQDSTRDEAVRRAERLRAGLVRYSEMRQDIADAFAGRDWIALGYEAWAAYVEGEFGEQLAQLGRGERQQAVSDLRGQGMSTRQIATATGISDMQVRRDLTQVRPDVAPAAVTGSDGKTYAATRPEPKPGPAPKEEPAEVPTKTAAVTSRSAASRELAEDIARDSERRAAVAGIRSVLLYLTSQAISPDELAKKYVIALADFTAEDLRFAAKTMAALAALKEQ